jgi:predicted nucleotidyltransferase
MSTVPSASPIAQALFSGARRAVLGLLFARPDEAFYLRQIVQITGTGVGQVQREVRQLSDAGIIRREVRDRHVYFQAETDCPIYKELRGIVTKTVGAASVLTGALAPLRRRIAVAFIYGSVARGRERRSSDVDLMVVGAATFAQVADAIRPAETRLGRPVNPTVYPATEFRDKVAAGHHFLKTVAAGPKLFVLGGEHEFATLLAERVDTPARDLAG